MRHIPAMIVLHDGVGGDIGWRPVDEDDCGARPPSHEVGLIGSDWRYLLIRAVSSDARNKKGNTPVPSDLLHGVNSG